MQTIQEPQEISPDPVLTERTIRSEAEMPNTCAFKMLTSFLRQRDTSRSATSLALSDTGNTRLPRSVFRGSPLPENHRMTACGGKADRALYRKRPSPGIFESTSRTSQSFVRLQRPLPVMRSLRPSFLFLSTSVTDAPSSAAETAAISPAAPAPITTTSGIGFPHLSVPSRRRRAANQGAADLQRS